jgi:hypothetical protein
MSTNTNSTKLDTLFPNLAQGVENASPEDLLAEARAEGQDTEQIASSVRSTLLDAVRSFEQRKLHAARHAYRKRSTDLMNKHIMLPATATARRALLLTAASNDQRVAKVTARFRDLKEISDEDVQSALEDLMELGALDDLGKDNNDGNE